ncbi:cytochrome P450 [Nocardia terpenica]|uniref:Cytochrome n=1 Tax=Nocardia terpenica TaxID=455432 RepID=A0A164M7S1_9NOCA|nr:cytochrome P450 [Nocardia terpenica]KZM73122.1 cytochrome [Nocardia terpenica]MBF6064306.1 cytochrome P450 [Nocardia terpenica]MBF6106639.1 cytochrome P450 [Nocardia terpenica]MBF6113924.1 cytochrome P450 [Nocardia terpenica]MBF6120452.1 cytochrome P450 [Nocardia terpenica]
MTESSTGAVTLPLVRDPDRPFDPPAELAELCRTRPLTRMTFPDGHLGWLVTGHEVARAMVADPRFSVRYELMHNPLNDVDMIGIPAAPGDLSGVDAPQHTRLRRALTAQFTVRRMNLLTERIRQITDEHLDAMARHGGPIDLVEYYAAPIPALMICELLGVPYGDHDFFREQISAVTAPESIEAMGEAWTRLAEYIKELAVAKRAAPTDDVLSTLTTTDLTDEELAGMGTFLLGAGMETTRSMIALGTFALLEHREQFDALRGDPDLAEGAVEELLRYLSIAHTGGRTALEDLELAGETIREGETVAIAVNAINRDPRRFDDPDTLDIRRRAVGHLAFGHGVHQCLGQQLARVELRVALPALAIRFPTLRLAVPRTEVSLRIGNILGVDRLPVTWES